MGYRNFTATSFSWQTLSEISKFQDTRNLKSEIHFQATFEQISLPYAYQNKGYLFCETRYMNLVLALRI
jgi:hypothetical protein